MCVCACACVCVRAVGRSEVVYEGEPLFPISLSQVSKQLLSSFTGTHDTPPYKDTCTSVQRLGNHDNRLLLLNTHHLPSPQNMAYMLPSGFSHLNLLSRVHGEGNRDT